MRCLGIPNTKHFHGVTKIADAQELWGRLSTVLEGQQFDVDQEEYEDSHGNVVNRVQYEDLARQGML
jgi:splicing factor 3A subunit 3